MAKDVGMQEATQKLRDRRAQAYVAAGEEKISDIHRKGLLTARERIEALLDPGTFNEQYLLAETISRDFGMDKKRYPGDAAVVGYGEIDKRRVCITATDSLIMGGSGASSHARKLVKTIDQAVKMGCPYIQLHDSSGGRIQEGTNITSYAGSTFYSLTQESGITLLIIEHVMHAVMSISDRIIVLHHGEKIGEGSPQQVAKDKKVMDAYLGEDFMLE